MQADKKQINRLLNIAKGQINGIQKMIEEGQYCIDISNQIMATIAILKKTNVEILDAHLHHCVLNAKNNEDLEVKMDEISKVIKNSIK